jgi:hypothetical protein
MATNNGAWYDYNNRVTPRVFFKSPDITTEQGVVKAGQVLKARSFVQSDVNGKLIAHTGLSEASVVQFATITTGQTLILGGLTFTAGSGSVTAAELVTIWSNLPAGITNTAANTQILAAGINATTKGTFTAGTFGAFNTRAYDAISRVMFTSTTALTNITDIADTGTATDPVITTIGGVTSFPAVAGVLIYDVDATAGDVKAEFYTEASFWASALVWYVDVNVDTITKFDGTTVACTAYNTGTLGYDALSTQLLQSKFVEGSEFKPLGFLSAGEIPNG